MQGVETEWREAWWRHRGCETSFSGPGGNSANPEARRLFLWGSWHLWTPSLVVEVQDPVIFVRCQADQNWLGIVSPLPFIEKIKTLDLLYGQYKELTLWIFSKIRKNYLSRHLWVNYFYIKLNFQTFKHQTCNS